MSVLSQAQTRRSRLLARIRRSRFVVIQAPSGFNKTRVLEEAVQGSAVSWITPENLAQTVACDCVAIDDAQRFRLGLLIPYVEERLANGHRVLLATRDPIDPIRSDAPRQLIVAADLALSVNDVHERMRALRGEATIEEARRLHEQTGGWPLLIDGILGLPTNGGPDRSENPLDLDEWLRHDLLGSLTEPLRQVILQCALLDRMTPEV